MQLSSSDYEIEGDKRNRTIFVRTFTNHSSTGLEDSLLITHEVKGEHKGRLMINKDGDVKVTQNNIGIGMGDAGSVLPQVNMADGYT